MIDTIHVLKAVGIERCRAWLARGLTSFIHPTTYQGGGIHGDQTALVAAAALLGAVCGLMGLRSWWLSALFFLALAMVVIGARYPRLCWGAILLVTVLPQAVPSSVSTLAFWGLVIAFLAGIAWQQREARRSVAWGDRRLCWCALAWLSWAMFSMSFSIEATASVKEWGRYVLSFAVLLGYLNWLRSETQIRGMVRWWEILSGLVAAVFIIVEVVRLLAGLAPAQILWAIPDASEISAMLAGFIPISVSLILAGGEPPVSSAARLAGTRRWPRVALVGLMGLALVLAGSRAAYVATIVGTMLVVCWLAPRYTRRLMIILGLLTLAACAMVWIQHGSLLAGLVHNLSGRDRVWVAAIDAIREHPLVGSGPGTWLLWFSGHFSSVDLMMHDPDGNWYFLAPYLLGGEAHNLLLTKGAEMGIPSMLLIAAMMAAWARAAVRSIRTLSPGWLRALSIGCLASMCGLLVYTMFENGPIIGKARGGEVIIVWLLAALPLVAGRVQTADLSERP